MHSNSIYGLSRFPVVGQNLDKHKLYLQVLAIIEEHAVDINEEATRTLRDGLQSLQANITADPEGTTFQSSIRSLEALLSSHRELITTFYCQRQGDVHAILSILADSAEALTTRGKHYNSSLNAFAEQLQAASRLRNLTEIRQALVRQSADLHRMVETIWQEDQRSVLQLQDQLASFQERLERAEKLAATDELTGLLNRREGEERLRKKIVAARPFCLLVMDVDRFKKINDELGHSAGDQVLRSVSRRLSNVARTADVVCRWGGDEFVILLDGQMSIATDRIRQIREAINGSHRLVLAGKESTVLVSVAIGAAECIAGEQGDDVFMRADQALYRSKRVLLKRSS